MFAAAHISLLSINGRVTHVYLHFVGPGCDVQNLRTIAELRCLPGLSTIYEYDRTRWSARHDDRSRLRQLRFPRTEPTAGRQAGHCH